MPLIDDALVWAGNGVPVFPVGQDKRPLCANGHKDASTDPQAVAELFANAPAAWGIGARMGREAGLFAIDADTYKPGASGDSARAFISSLEQAGLLPVTRTHKTVSGGAHYILSSDTAWPNTKPADGVEVKGEGGYIVVPPTPGYEVVREGVAEAPAALQQRLQQNQAASRLTTIDALKAQILSGESFHDAATQLAAKLAADGMPVEKIQATLTATFDASLASKVNHPRHMRWVSFTSNKGGELARIINSGNAKFNPAAVSNKLREAAISSGMIGSFTIPAPVNEGVATAVATDPLTITDWPFEGYFGTERLNVLDQSFVAYPILADGETGMISAEPKAGKTLVAQTLAMHIAAGAHLGEIKIKESRPALYFALESQVAIRRRLEAWRRSVDPTGTILTDRTFPFFVAERPLNLTVEQNRKDLAAKIAAADRQLQDQGFPPIGLVVFDTLTKLMPGGNQNQAEDTSAVFSITDEIRSLGINPCVLFIHHDNKQGKERGSTNIQAEPDILLGVGTNPDTDLLELTIRMARSVEDQHKFLFRAVNTLLGQSKDGYEIRAPLAIAYDAAGVKSIKEDHKLKKLMVEQELLDMVAAKGLGGHAFIAIHKMLSAAFTPDKYPVGGKIYKSVAVQEYWAQLIPATGRLSGNSLILPQMAVRRGAVMTSTIESLLIKAVSQGTGFDQPQQALPR